MLIVELPGAPGSGGTACPRPAGRCCPRRCVELRAGTSPPSPGRCSGTRRSHWPPMAMEVCCTRSGNRPPDAGPQSSPPARRGSRVRRICNSHVRRRLHHRSRACVPSGSRAGAKTAMIAAAMAGRSSCCLRSKVGWRADGRGHPVRAHRPSSLSRAVSFESHLGGLPALCGRVGASGRLVRGRAELRRMRGRLRATHRARCRQDGRGARGREGRRGCRWASGWAFMRLGVGRGGQRCVSSGRWLGAGLSQRPIGGAGGWAGGWRALPALCNETVQCHLGSIIVTVGRPMRRRLLPAFA